MKILFVATEVAPIAKAGGMGDVVGTLPKVLRQLGHDVRIMIPYYGFLPDKMEVPKQPIWSASVMDNKFDIYETVLPGSDVPLYLLGHLAFVPKYIYSGEEFWRFTFFSRGATEFARKFWKPDIIHCHDWHTGMIPVWVYQDTDIYTTFTIHNLAYQGPWIHDLEQITTLPWYMQGNNVMSAAIIFANGVNTVSPTYAKQIQTAEYGENLEGLLFLNKDKVKGIVNGIDLDSFNPGTDQKIVKNYTIDTLDKREANKVDLQKELGLEPNPNAFMMGMVSRLVEQKGLDILLKTLDPFLSNTDAQLVVLGTGDPDYESELEKIGPNFPTRAGIKIAYSDALARKIYSASDTVLMPSRFEPCGITQMIAMRYGSVPVVRSTGGLVDTVSSHDPVKGTGTGFCFEGYSSLELYGAMIRGWESFKYKEQWTGLQQRGMKEDFSWYQSTVEYIKMYRSIMGQSPALTDAEKSKLAQLSGK